MVDGESLAKGWIWIFTGVGAFFALRGAWRRRRQGPGPPADAQLQSTASLGDSADGDLPGDDTNQVQGRDRPNSGNSRGDGHS